MPEIKERPILFSGPMVRAILDGRKTVTRRAIKSYWIQSERAPIEVSPGVFYLWCSGEHSCPYGMPGDRLWVRETYADIGCRLTYRADTDDGAHCKVKKWTPAIHMLRKDSRILLEVMGVWVERLQDITYEQTVAEGVYRGNTRVWTATDEGSVCHKYPERAFQDLWISTGGDWDANPWVWAVEFKRIQP